MIFEKYNIFITETKIFGARASSFHLSFGFQSGGVVNSTGRDGGLALFLSLDGSVEIQSFGQRHIDTSINSADGLRWRFTGFYGQTK